MKSKITPAPQPAQLPYPKLMKSKIGKIVLMTAHGVGTVLSDEQGYAKVGQYGGDWSMENFTDFHGTITLSNN
jgi:hypothetical protein